jgi:hypothetical protein
MLSRKGAIRAIWRSFVDYLPPTLTRVSNRAGSLTKEQDI